MLNSRYMSVRYGHNGEDRRGHQGGRAIARQADGDGVHGPARERPEEDQRHVVGEHRVAGQRVNGPGHESRREERLAEGEAQPDGVEGVSLHESVGLRHEIPEGRDHRPGEDARVGVVRVQVREVGHQRPGVEDDRAQQEDEHAEVGPSHRLSCRQASRSAPVNQQPNASRSTEQGGVLVEEGQDTLASLGGQREDDAVDPGRPVPVEGGGVGLASEHGDRDGLRVATGARGLGPEVLELRSGSRRRPRARAGTSRRRTRPRAGACAAPRRPGGRAGAASGPAWDRTRCGSKWTNSPWNSASSFVQISFMASTRSRITPEARLEGRCRGSPSPRRSSRRRCRRGSARSRGSRGWPPPSR